MYTYYHCKPVVHCSFTSPFLSFSLSLSLSVLEYLFMFDVSLSLSLSLSPPQAPWRRALISKTINININIESSFTWRRASISSWIFPQTTPVLSVPFPLLVSTDPMDIPGYL